MVTSIRWNIPISALVWTSDVIPAAHPHRRHTDLLMSAAKFTIWKAYTQRAFADHHPGLVSTAELRNTLSLQLIRLIHVIRYPVGQPVRVEPWRRAAEYLLQKIRLAQD